MKNNKIYKNYRTVCFFFIIIIIYILSIQIVYATTDIDVSDSDYYGKAATACLNFENDIFIKGGNVYSINFDKLISSVKSKTAIHVPCTELLSLIAVLFLPIYSPPPVPDDTSARFF